MTGLKLTKLETLWARSTERGSCPHERRCRGYRVSNGSASTVSALHRIIPDFAAHMKVAERVMKKRRAVLRELAK